MSMNEEDDYYVVFKLFMLGVVVLRTFNATHIILQKSDFPSKFDEGVPRGLHGNKQKMVKMRKR